MPIVRRLMLGIWEERKGSQKNEGEGGEDFGDFKRSCDGAAFGNWMEWQVPVGSKRWPALLREPL